MNHSFDTVDERWMIDYYTRKRREEKPLRDLAELYLKSCSNQEPLMLVLQKNDNRPNVGFDYYINKPYDMKGAIVL